MYARSSYYVSGSSLVVEGTYVNGNRDRKEKSKQWLEGGVKYYFGQGG